jgi:predicted nucleic acid-binding protein
MPFTTQKIFLDSSFFISFVDRTNFNHLKATQIMEELAKQSYQLFTSELTITQSYNRLEKEVGSIVADEFLQAVLESSIQILYPEEVDFLATYRLLKVLNQRNAPFSEILNSSLMDRYRVYHILTFDPWHNLQKTQVSSLVG